MNEIRDETLDLEQAAEYLHASIRLVQQLATTGELPGARIGRRWVFQRAAIAAYLARQVARQTDERKARHGAEPATEARSPGRPRTPIVDDMTIDSMR